MKTHIPLRRLAAPAGAAALILGAVLIPTSAQAAQTGAQTTDATIVVEDATGGPVPGAEVEVTGTWTDALDQTAIDAAEADYQQASAESQAWFDAQDRPAQAAYDRAYQAFQDGSGTVGEWLATLPAQGQEMRAIQEKFEGSALDQAQRAAAEHLADVRDAAFDAATETRTLHADADGEVEVAPAIGGSAIRPTATAGGDVVELPFAPSSTTHLTAE